MVGSLAVRDLGSVGRSRLPAFLPADLIAEPQGGLYQSLYKRLRGFILDGVWPAGTRLPSSRALASDLKVSRNTAILAVEQLIADGWAESRSRSGVYVSASPLAPMMPVRALAPMRGDAAPFALHRPATDLFPAQIWKQLQARAWAEIDPDRLANADPAGDAGLREAIARLVCAPRGLRCHPDQILIVPTATAAIDLVAATLLHPGDTALVEDPSRPVVKQLLRARGARLELLPVAADGPDLSALALSNARLACVAPAVQFPTGATMKAADRAYLIAWARASEAWIVEDDRDADMGQDSAPVPLAAADGDRVIFVGSFNRVLFPGLCVAYLVAPPGLIDRLRAVHAIVGGRASLASQVALNAFIGEGHLARHLRHRRQAYADRRQALVDGLAPGNGGGAPLGAAGLHMLLPLRTGGAGTVAAGLAAAGLGGASIDDFFEHAGAGRHVLLGLGAPVDMIRACAPQVAALVRNLYSEHKGDS